MFNLTRGAIRRQVKLDPGTLGWKNLKGVQVDGTQWRLDSDTLVLTFDLSELSPAHAVLRQGRGTAKQ